MTALDVLKNELGDERMKMLVDLNLNLLVQWAMIQYADHKVKLLNEKPEERSEIIDFLIKVKNESKVPRLLRERAKELESIISAK